MRQSETEPRTPDETLAARLERMAGDKGTAAYYVNDLYDAAKRLRELAADMRWLEERAYADGTAEIRHRRFDPVFGVCNGSGKLLGSGPTLAAAIADARQQLAQGGAND